jgi:hypothetical protein
MRQRVGAKKVARYRRQTGLPVVGALVRGGTDHRVDLLLEGGIIMEWWPKTDEMQQSCVRWRDDEYHKDGPRWTT